MPGRRKVKVNPRNAVEFETFIHPQKFLLSTSIFPIYKQLSQRSTNPLILENEFSSNDDGDYVLTYGKGSQQNHKRCKYIEISMKIQNDE